MKYREGAVIEALQRGILILIDCREELAASDSADFARALKKAEDVLARLLQFGVDQDSGFRGSLGETAKQERLRLDLVKDWLTPIARIARRHKRSVPDFAALQMPPESARAHAFCASARGMIAAASAHHEALVSYGLPESFVEDLNRKVDEFEASLLDRASNRGRRAAGTKGLEEETKEARLVLAVLDARMRQWAKGNEKLLGAWEAARRIRRRPGPVSHTATATTSESVMTSAASDPAAATETPLKLA